MKAEKKSVKKRSRIKKDNSRRGMHTTNQDSLHFQKSAPKTYHAAVKGVIQDKKHLVKRMSSETASLVLVFRVTLVALLFVLFSYFFEFIDFFLLSAVLVFFMLCGAIVIYMVAESHPNEKNTKVLRITARLLKLSTIMVLLSMLVQTIMPRLIFLYLGLFMFSVSLHEVIYLAMLKKHIMETLK